VRGVRLVWTAVAAVSLAVASLVAGLVSDDPAVPLGLAAVVMALLATRER